jgi:ATP-binding cassette, subfamily B, bacterial HlyB/CyaB
VVVGIGISLCVTSNPFQADLLVREFPPPNTPTQLIQAARAQGLKIRECKVTLRNLKRLSLPMLVHLRGEEPVSQTSDTRPANEMPVFGLITAFAQDKVVFLSAGGNQPETYSWSSLFPRLSGQGWMIAKEAEKTADPDNANAGKTFGFGWFVPELLKHKRVWRDVLLASLALQIISLATPLFTQAIIDKVVVHRTQSTLITIGIAMVMLIVFSSLLTWVRQYLVLHTGNRVDAVLGAAVWDRLLRLPLTYFRYRPTGVVSARMHGVETIREFVSGAAVSLILDLPFLLICLAVMLWYSVMLTLLVLGFLLVIAIASAIVAPVFQQRLNQQFLLGARNQAFLTEHISGFETVKSLQMEPQLRQRYSGYLASLLQSSFSTKQIGNTYHVFAGTLEQLMTAAVLLVGAWVVMTQAQLTIGMLVAFQMFAGKLSQPVMRLVGLWSQFQQASLSVQRMGDLMNAPMEPYGLIPQRQSPQKGRIEVHSLAFRYEPDLPLLYENLSLSLEPGVVMAITGASGKGKSTFAKLLMGFYPANSGSIRIDGIDIRHMSANELRAYFGVVPQETILFSGTVLDNLRAGQPGASFEQVVQAASMSGIHSVIEALPKGYQTELGERGAGLSGGQKQRLAIARALLKGPKILIFDEATSALDEQTAEAFATTINGLRGKVSMLFITHALPKSLRVDRTLHLP